MAVETTERVGEFVQELDIAKIDVHRLNPRKEVGDVADLAASIKSEGVIQPILVVRDNGGYAAVHGSRRLAAAKLAGLDRIPAIVRELTDAQVAEIAIVENVQREDLSPLELAEAYQAYLRTFPKRSVADLAAQVGKTRGAVANTIRLLKAPPQIKSALQAGELTPAHVRVLFQLADPSLMDRVSYVGSVEDLTYEVEELNTQWRLEGPEAAAAAKAFLAEQLAKLPNVDITWRASENDVPLEQLLGKPPKPIVEDYGTEVGLKQHDKLCGCTAWRVFPDVTRTARGRGQVEHLIFKLRRVCVSQSGARKVNEARDSRTRSTSASGSSSESTLRTKPKTTPAQREKARIRKEKEKTEAATRALEGRQRYGGRDDTKIDPRLVKGKLDGEVARLALFAISSKFSSEFVDGWRPALWRKIAKLSLKDVKTRTAAWMARAALDEIDSRKAERQELRELVLGHYGIEVKAPAKKKAKR